MNKSKWSALFCFSLGGMMLFLHFFMQPVTEGPDALSTKMNLAIRQAVHNLHKIAEDSTSMIGAVQLIDENMHRIVIERAINYDTLPAVLDASLQDYEIEEEYMVSIIDCELDEILLGYNRFAFEKGQVACKGRERNSDCNVLNVTFDTEKNQNSFYLPFAFLSFILGGIGLFISAKILDKKDKEINSPTSSINAIQIGNSSFEPQNLSIQIAGNSKKLTFRESKLLEYFALRPNQVLKREDIQDAVWSEEGVIVGRSLDVFISRLRKILKGDERVAIKNIHGVGYRLEVQ